MSVFYNNLPKLLQKLALCALAVCLGLTMTSTSYAQGGGGGGGGGGDGGGVPVTPPVQEPQDPVIDPGAGGGTGDPDSNLADVEPFQLERDIDDVRNQGFVGSTGQLVNEQGFIGTASETTAGGPAEGRSFGGGGINIGTEGGLGTTNPVNENGFRVTRRGIRAKLVPRFAAPNVSNNLVESRFASRMSRQPVVNRLGQGVTIRVENKTATISGYADSAAEVRLIERQLRLEPGVYRIVNNTEIASQPAAQFQQSEQYYIPGQVNQISIQPSMTIDAPQPPVEGTIEVRVPQSIGR